MGLMFKSMLERISISLINRNVEIKFSSTLIDPLWEFLLLKLIVIAIRMK